MGIVFSVLTFRELVRLHRLASVSQAWQQAWTDAIRAWVATQADLRRFLGPPVREHDFMFWLRFARNNDAERARIAQAFTLAELRLLRVSQGLLMEKMEAAGWRRFQIAGYRNDNIRQKYQAAIDASGADLQRMMSLDDECRPEQVATLELEPTNFHDQHAIKVMVGEHHVGYLRKINVAGMTPQQRAAWTVPAAVRLCVDDGVEPWVWCPPA